VGVALLNHFVSSQLPFIGIAKSHITIRDIDALLDHSYWDRRRPGRIGGKAAGLLLAYKILLPRLNARDPELERLVTIPESYYFNSGIFSDFIDHNGLHRLHSQKYKHRESLEEEYEEIKRLFEKASFPDDVVRTSGIFWRRSESTPSSCDRRVCWRTASDSPFPASTSRSLWPTKASSRRGLGSSSEV
jgi:hypothetical protein